MPQETVEELIVRKVDGVVRFMERDRLSVLGIFLYVLTVSLIRDLSEYYLLDAVFVATSHPWIFSIAHHVSFYMVIFLGLVLLLAAFSGRGVRRSANVITSIFWIVILPPYLDHFLFGLDANYSYASATDFLNALVHFSGASFNPGQAMEIAVVLAVIFGYTIWQVRDQLDTVLGRSLALARVAAVIFFSFLTMFILATPGAYLPVGYSDGLPVFPNFDSTRYVQFHQLLTAYYVVIGCVLLLLLGLISLGRDLVTYIRSLRPAQTFFFGGIVLAGMAMGWRAEGGDEIVLSVLQTPFWVNLPYAILGVISALLLWHVSAMWNDIADRQTDDHREDRLVASGAVSHGSFLSVSLVLLIISLLLASLLSMRHVMLIAMLAALAYIYSFPPLRLKRHAMSPLLIGMGTSLAFIYGYTAPFSEVAGFEGRDLYYLTGEVISAPLGPFAIMVAAFMFIGLVVGSLITDIDGYGEDSRAGIQTIYTSAGMERGVAIVSVLIFLSALSPLVLLPNTLDLATLGALGAVGSIAFLKWRSSRAVMTVAAIGLIYVGFRLFLV